MNKTEALNIMAKEAFINDSDITDDIWIDMFYSNTFNLEHYAAYIYISNLYIETSLQFSSLNLWVV